MRQGLAEFIVVSTGICKAIPISQVGWQLQDEILLRDEKDVAIHAHGQAQFKEHVEVVFIDLRYYEPARTYLVEYLVEYLPRFHPHIGAHTFQPNIS